MTLRPREAHDLMVLAFNRGSWAVAYGLARLLLDNPDSFLWKKELIPATLEIERTSSQHLNTQRTHDAQAQ